MSSEPFQFSGKRPRFGPDTYEESASSSIMQQTVYPPFAISPFRRMVVRLHTHLDRRDIIKMAYIMELPDTFEEEMGPSRDPLLFLMLVAERVGRVKREDVDLLIESLIAIKKPENVVKLVKDYNDNFLHNSPDATVWKIATLQPVAEQKATEKDYTNYWVKFKEWCGKRNVLNAKEASCKVVVDYLNSLTSSNKLYTIMNYYKGILQHHKEFKSNDKMKLEACIKIIREQEKKTKR